MKRHRMPLGELCNLVKGNSPISRTPSGPYPLVTTGENRKTADTFQFDEEAVCIPLISSTGHGHASLKRVHYQAGKFALGNLLAAAIVKNHLILSTNFLAKYLMFTKDQLIVPLMTGAANMSIGLDRLATVPVEFPQLAQQVRIVKLLDDADELTSLRAQANRRTADLIPALFYDMFGDPSGNPQSWPKEKLGEICELVNGAPFKPSDWDGSGLPIVRIQNLNDKTRPFNLTTKQLPEKFRVRPGDILLSWSGTPGTSFGCYRWNGPEGWLNQHIFNVKVKQCLDGEFFIQSVNARLGELIARAHGGVGLQHVTKGMINTVEIFVPPLPRQVEFAKCVTRARELKAMQAASRERLDALFHSMLHLAFQGEL